VSAIDDGGPAYPCQQLDRQGMPTMQIEFGLTIRDHFAGLAMQAIIALDLPNTLAKDCGVAYEYADAMLLARKVTP